MRISSVTMRIGLMTGSLTRTICCQALAPSMRAASMTLPSMPCSAASTMISTKGVHCQMSVTMIAKKARPGSASQARGATPSAPDHRLMGPKLASKR